jgi:hypothetical protein
MSMGSRSLSCRRQRMRCDRRIGGVLDAEAANTRQRCSALFPARKIARPVARRKPVEIDRAPGIPIMRLRNAFRRGTDEGAHDEQYDRPTHRRSPEWIELTPRRSARRPYRKRYRSYMAYLRDCKRADRRVIPVRRRHGGSDRCGTP